MNWYDLFISNNLLDTPRLFTGVAEWCGVMMTVAVHKHKKTGPLLVALCFLFFIIQTGFQVLAGMSAISFWVPNMILAVVIMYLEIKLVVDAPPLVCGFYTMQAFLLAEFSASIYRQIYVWYIGLFKPEIYLSFILSAVFMLITYAAVFIVIFMVEKRGNNKEVAFDIKPKDFFAALATGIGAFSFSNLSFVWPGTPFSVDSNNILYVRTLVDLGGGLMLMTQKDRIVETSISSQNLAINQLFRRQYEQYKLSVDNSEMLRKEIHDLKHYLIALKNESSPEKKQEYLEELEQEIAIQESFQNTGNQVLDVILTNKSLECRKKNIVFKVMADGDVLSFLHVKDICALFGNLLDNAIEATQMNLSADNRMINLSVKQKNNFVVVECTNGCEQEVKIPRRADLPKTTKNDKQLHGYGLKSIKQIAEKYNGSMTFSQEKSWVTIKVLLTKGN